MNVLDGYLLELYKKDPHLARTLQFIIFQLNRIDQQLELNISPEIFSLETNETRSHRIAARLGRRL